MPPLLLALLIGYLLGSIPFAHIIARAVGGVELAEVGSRNVGTRNLTRNLGLGWGVLGGVLDFSKGLAAMAIGEAVAGGHPWWMLAGTAAVAGHNWPVWLRFRGGKGLATALGAAAWVAAWPELAIVFALGWVVQRLTGNITLTAAVGFVVMLLSLQATGRPPEVTYFVLSLAAAVLLATWPDISAKLKKPGEVQKYFKDPNAVYKKKTSR
ncbi:MAG: glycerol-3-phosphate acyltransferase [Anaerolineales bacterium]|nr:MAG: glycerol-3-phosphate acyltransferase [Anaerolineales bacterium]